MSPVPSQKKGARFKTFDVTCPMHFNLSLFDGHLMTQHDAVSPKGYCKAPIQFANATILRTYLSDNVKRYEINAGRHRGTLFVPKGNGKFPG